MHGQNTQNHITGNASVQTEESRVFITISPCINCWIRTVHLQIKRGMRIVDGTISMASVNKHLSVVLCLGDHVVSEPTREAEA